MCHNPLKYERFGKVSLSRCVSMPREAAEAMAKICMSLTMELAKISVSLTTEVAKNSTSLRGAGALTHGFVRAYGAHER
jgi:hypothetical protein